jgi:hypothetical protein
MAALNELAEYQHSDEDIRDKVWNVLGFEFRLQFRFNPTFFLSLAGMRSD